MARRIASPDLIERSEQLAALRDALTGAADASPSISLVAGEPGVGKSRLVAELRRTPERSRWLVLIGGQPSARLVWSASLVARSRMRRGD